MHLFKPASEIPELQEGRLLQLVERCVSPVNMSCTRQLMHMIICSVYVCFCQVLDTISESSKELLFDV